MNDISFHISIALDFFFLSFEFRFRNPRFDVWISIDVDA